MALEAIEDANKATRQNIFCNIDLSCEAAIGRMPERNLLDDFAGPRASGTPTSSATPTNT